MSDRTDEHAAEPQSARQDAASPASEADPQPFALHRLHPATILIDFLRRLGQLVYFIAVVLILRLTGRGGGGDWHDWALTAIAVFGSVSAVLRYVSLRYALEGDRLVLRSGLITRQKRTIPADRIQNIELKRGVLHRLLGVVDVSVETAGGSEPEAKLSALSVREAERLKSELLRRRDGAAAPAAVAAETAPLWRSTLGELILLGATENRAGLIIGSIAGLWYTFGDAARELRAPLERWVFQRIGGDALSAAALAAVLVLGLMVAGWLVSIVLTTVEYYRFELLSADGRLRRRFGLLMQRDTMLPLERIQVVRLESPLPRRLLGYSTIHAETAGSVVERAAGGTSPLSPLIRTAQAAELVGRVLAGFDLRTVEWRRVSRATIRRGMVRYSIVGALAVLALMLAVRWELLALLPPALALAWVAAHARYRAIGFAEAGDYVCAREGVWTRRTWIVPRGKIQSLDCSSTPFQRRLNLASVRIATAGGQGASANPTIVDLPADEARPLQDRLSHAAAERGLWLADGV